MEVTEAIARGLTTLIPADIHIGITGLPCPGGSETAEKPIGTMSSTDYYAALNGLASGWSSRGAISRFLI
jgi:nicotinamide mononucleotide (NMN) deamidase PncC